LIRSDPSSRELIYAEVPNGGLVFMERSKALENIAFRAAVTWGDFRTPTLYERALADLDAEENPQECDRKLFKPVSERIRPFVRLDASVIVRTNLEAQCRAAALGSNGDRCR
jgi:hypothetical protein